MPTIFTRTRTKTEQGWNDFTTHSHRVGNNGWYDEGPYTAPCQVYLAEETMHDMEPAGGPGKYPDRPCHHISERTSVSEIPECTRVISRQSRANTGSGTPLLGGTYLAPVAQVGEAPSFPAADPKSALLESLNPASEVLAGLPFIGEVHSTIAMIRNPLSFLSSLPLPRSKRRTSLGSHLESLGLGKTSNAWLQYNYGWAPLMGDLGNVAQGLAEFSGAYDLYRRGDSTVRKASKRIHCGASEEERVGTFSKVVTKYSRFQKYNMRYRYDPTAGTQAELSRLQFLAQKSGLSLGNLAVAAWELMPYSFVVDWFIPVGSALTAIKKTPCNISILSENYHDTVTSVTTEWRRFEPESYLGMSSQPTSFDEGWSRTTERKQYWRDVEGHGPDPDFFGSGLTTKRTVSALSLIAQQLMMPIRR